MYPAMAAPRRGRAAGARHAAGVVAGALAGALEGSRGGRGGPAAGDAAVCVQSDIRLDQRSCLN